MSVHTNDARMAIKLAEQVAASEGEREVGQATALRDALRSIVQAVEDLERRVDAIEHQHRRPIHHEED